MAHYKMQMRQSVFNGIIKIPLKTNNVNNNKLNKNTFVNLYNKYLQDKENGLVRFYGTIKMLSPLAKKEKIPLVVSDLFQDITNGLQIDDFNIYFGRVLSKDSIGNNQFRERILIYDSNLFVDKYEFKISEDIFGNKVYNFVINGDFNNDETYYIIIDKDILLPNTIIDGDIYDNEDNKITINYKNYQVDIGTDTYDYFYDNKYILNYSNEDPLVNNYHYSYNNILFKLLPDFNSGLIENIYSTYINEEIINKVSPNNFDATCNI